MLLSLLKHLKHELVILIANELRRELICFVSLYGICLFSRHCFTLVWLLVPLPYMDINVNCHSDIPLWVQANIPYITIIESPDNGHVGTLSNVFFCIQVEEA